MKEKFNTESKAGSLVEACISARTKINIKTLAREKYNLISDIKNTWNIDDFFSSRVSNYKVLASIYKVFEYKVEDNPKMLVDSKYTLLEHITFNAPKGDNSTATIVDSFTNEDKDIRNLAYRLMLEKFNTKYSKLDARQRNLLKKYITEVSNTTDMKKYITSESIKLTKELHTLNKSVTDKSTKIKITESVNLLSELTKGKVVKDEEVLALMKYYELTKELKKAVQ